MCVQPALHVHLSALQCVMQLASLAFSGTVKAAVLAGHSLPQSLQPVMDMPQAQTQSQTCHSHEQSTNTIVDTPQSCATTNTVIDMPQSLQPVMKMPVVNNRFGQKLPQQQCCHRSLSGLQCALTCGCYTCMMAMHRYNRLSEWPMLQCKACERHKTCAATAVTGCSLGCHEKVLLKN